MTKFSSEIAAFGNAVGLDNDRAAYLLDAWEFYCAARGVLYDDHRCIENPELIACNLMQAAMTAKYQGAIAKQLDMATDYLCGLDGMDTLADATRELSESQASDLRELTEAVRTVADGNHNVCHSLEALRGVIDNHLEVMQRRMATPAANDGSATPRKARA